MDVQNSTPAQPSLATGFKPVRPRTDDPTSQTNNSAATTEFSTQSQQFSDINGTLANLRERLLNSTGEEEKARIKDELATTEVKLANLHSSQSLADVDAAESLLGQLQGDFEADIESLQALDPSRVANLINDPS